MAGGEVVPVLAALGSAPCGTGGGKKKKKHGDTLMHR